MGQRGNTASVVLSQDGARIRAVGFGMGDLADYCVGVNHVDIAAVPLRPDGQVPTLLLEHVPTKLQVEQDRQAELAAVTEVANASRSL